MDEFLRESLKYAKNFLQSYSYKHEFYEYARGYLFTTEYINRYLEQNFFNKGKALTVLSSGDHVFNLVLHGVYNIDTVDINKLNYFTFWLKFAFILNLSFKEFKRLESVISKDHYLLLFLNFLERSKADMPKEVYIYFRELVLYECSLMGKSNGLRSLYLPTYTTFRPTNAYLKSKDEYDALKDKLGKLNINMYFDDIRSIPKLVNDNYDIILLSNISDYLGTIDKPLTYEEFKNYISSFLPLLKDEGLIINYLYGLRHKCVIQNSSITLDDLGRENIVRLTRGIDSEGYYRVRKNK